MSTQTALDRARAVADAVLYEGYLLYPYRASSRKNQVRWQFGVLGPPGAASAGTGEEPAMTTVCLLRPTDAGSPTGPTVTVRLRFLQVQARVVERYEAPAGWARVESAEVDGQELICWDEAVEQERVLGFPLTGTVDGATATVDVPGGEEVQPLAEDIRVVRRRWPLNARVTVRADEDDGHLRVTTTVENVHPVSPRDRDEATRSSLVGAHLVLEAGGGHFVSVIDPPEPARTAAGRCTQHRCWPVLAGDREVAGPGTSDLVLATPIILYDHPEVAEQSPGALFDSTEIDEILTLRVMTMTEPEKAEARATDPRAREIIDRCDAMPPETLQRLHGILRDPYAPATPPADPHPPADVRDVEPPTFGEVGVPWWDPSADAAVRPEVDGVVVAGVRVSKGSLVRVRPNRRADAQDLFFAGRVARVTAVLADVDGGVHVALVLEDDPGADLQEWYGRYWYFAPDELEPLAGTSAGPPPDEHREENRS